MPRISVDMTEAVSFQPVDKPGTYEMKVASIGDPEPSKKGTMCVRADFQFLDEKLHKKCGLVFKSLPIEGPGAGFFRDFWHKVVGEELPDDAPIDVDTDDAIGKEVMAEISVDEKYQSNNIDKLIAAP